MQRLNAIVSFIENDYSIDGEYFDLETLAESKNLLDKGLLTQKLPKMNRDICTQLASYSIPLSVYSIDNHQRIDDIFKRVNAYGKHLSKQELRVAGSTGKFSSLVRKISASIRMDTSPSDILLLNKMKEISITNSRESGYGILADELFWVKNYTLTRDNVRESKDEEIVADILYSVIFPDKYAINSENRDSFYGFVDSELSTLIDDALTKLGEDELFRQMIATYDVLRNVLIHARKNFRDLVFLNNQYAQRIPYFTTIFLAFLQTLHK